MNKHYVCQFSIWVAIIFFVFINFIGFKKGIEINELLVLCLISLFNLIIGCSLAISNQLKDMQKGISNE